MNLLLNCKTYPINVDVRLYGVFSARSRIVHSFEDVTITSEGLQILTYAPALMTFVQWGFFIVSNLLWQGASVSNGHLRNTHTYCRAFGSGAVITCFNELGPSPLGFEHQLSACEANTETHCTTAAAQNLISEELTWVFSSDELK